MLVVLIVLLRTFSADVYDAVVTQRLTTPWYRAVLSRLEPVSCSPSALLSLDAALMCPGRVWPSESAHYPCV